MDGRRRWLWAALAAYVLAGLVLTLVPSNPLDRDVRSWRLDVPVNLVMLGPPVALALLAWPRLRPLVAVAAASALSAAIEVVQKFSPRESSLLDWALNTAGAAVAAVVVAAGRARHRGP